MPYHVALLYSVQRLFDREWNVLGLNLDFISIASLNFDCSAFFVLPFPAGNRDNSLSLSLGFLPERDSNFIERNDPATQIRLRRGRNGDGRNGIMHQLMKRSLTKRAQKRAMPRFFRILKITLPVVGPPLWGKNTETPGKKSDRETIRCR